MLRLRKNSRSVHGRRDLRVAHVRRDRFYGVLHRLGLLRFTPRVQRRRSRWSDVLRRNGRKARDGRRQPLLWARLARQWRWNDHLPRLRARADVSALRPSILSWSRSVPQREIAWLTSPRQGRARDVSNLRASRTRRLAPSYNSPHHGNLFAKGDLPDGFSRSNHRLCAPLAP